MRLKNPIPLLRRVAFIEGISFLVLLGVAMPLKYLAGVALATRVVGLLHGLAFLAYAVVLIDLFSTRRWPQHRLWLGLLAGALPAGSFLFARQLRRESTGGLASEG